MHSTIEPGAAPLLLHSTQQRGMTLLVKSNGGFKTACLQDQGKDRAWVSSPSHLVHGLLIPKKQGLGGGQIWVLFDDYFFLNFMFWRRQSHQGKLLIRKWVLHSPGLHHYLCAWILAAKAIGCSTTDFKRRMSGFVGAAGSSVYIDF